MVFGVVHEAAYYRPEAAYPSRPPCFLTLQCVFAAHLLPVSYVEVADEPVGLECCPEPVVCSLCNARIQAGISITWRLCGHNEVVARLSMPIRAE